MTNIRDIRQKEFIDNIITNGFNGIYIIAPRVGKSRCIIESLRHISNWSVAIITPRENINESWEAELIKWKADFIPTILCARSLNKVKKLAKLDLLIVDECQTLSETQLKVLKTINPKRLILMTGTLKKSKEMMFRERFNLSTHVNYNIDDAIKDGIIADYNINIIKVELTTTEKAIIKKLNDSYEYACKQAYVQPSHGLAKKYTALKRMNYIYNLESKINAVEEFIKTQERYIMFVASTTVSDKLSPDNSFNSKTRRYDILDSFIKGDLKNITAVKMLEMGFTVHNLKTCIIQQIQSNEEIFLQRALRCCNLDNDGNIANIYIFVSKDTVDEKWLQSCLKDVDVKRIKYLN